MVPGLEVFPRVSSDVILADGVGVISWILGYLVDFMGVIIRDRKTGEGQMCSWRGGGEARGSLRGENGKGETVVYGCRSPDAPRTDALRA